MGIFVDVKEAFDSVNHGNLLRKLTCAGIHGTADNLLMSYVTDRSQIVKIIDKCSQFLNINHGVPQGTVFGPFFFYYIHKCFIKFKCQRQRP